MVFKSASFAPVVIVCVLAMPARAQTADNPSGSLPTSPQARATHPTFAAGVDLVALTVT